jgi:hypothetical protein
MLEGLLAGFEEKPKAVEKAVFELDDAELTRQSNAQLASSGGKVSIAMNPHCMTGFSLRAIMQNDCLDTV